MGSAHQDALRRRAAGVRPVIRYLAPLFVGLQLGITAERLAAKAGPRAQFITHTAVLAAAMLFSLVHLITWRRELEASRRRMESHQQHLQDFAKAQVAAEIQRQVAEYAVANGMRAPAAKN